MKTESIWPRPARAAPAWPILQSLWSGGCAAPPPAAAYLWATSAATCWTCSNTAGVELAEASRRLRRHYPPAGRSTPVWGNDDAFVFCGREPAGAVQRLRQPGRAGHPPVHLRRGGLLPRQCGGGVSLTNPKPRWSLRPEGRVRSASPSRRTRAARRAAAFLDLVMRPVEYCTWSRPSVSGAPAHPRTSHPMGKSHAAEYGGKSCSTLHQLPAVSNWTPSRTGCASTPGWPGFACWTNSAAR